MPLCAYNRFENWDLAPSSTATGSVTMFFDNYKKSLYHCRVRSAGNPPIGWSLAERGCGGQQWLASAGSVKSNTVSTWSPFALSIISSTSPLSVKLTAFIAARQGEAAHMAWAMASERNSAYSEAEASPDGTAFRAVGRVTAQGDTAQRHDY
jgi:hypothetical protein